MRLTESVLTARGFRKNGVYSAAVVTQVQTILRLRSQQLYLTRNHFDS